MSHVQRTNIHRFFFSEEFLNNIDSNYYLKNNWPIVYLLSNSSTKKIYIGETIDFYTRMTTHLKTFGKKEFNTLHVITSDQFNKSATLDIESYLIQYISADRYWKLLNLNIGLSDHNYLEKSEKYWPIFETIWKGLKECGITFNSLVYLNNSDLFKYSPFKSLNFEQKKGLIRIMDALLNNDVATVVAEGGAGTGKSIMATYLFKLLMTDIEDFNYKYFGEHEPLFIALVRRLKKKYEHPKLAMVIPVTSFHATIKKLFKKIEGLNASMVIKPADLIHTHYDIIIVDEAHRLRRGRALGAYIGNFYRISRALGFDPGRNTELDWVQKRSKKSIIFYDKGQSVRASDVRKNDFITLKSDPGTETQRLEKQMRSQGGNKYIKFATELLDCSLRTNSAKYSSSRFDLLLFDSVTKMRYEIRLRDKETGLSRMVAGYSWEWVSKNNPKLYDIRLENQAYRWNKITNDWINSGNAVNEIGCIHTTQGYDLNYTGIIFGREISYDRKKKEIIILKEYYYDKIGKIADSDLEVKEYIINIYRTIMQRSIKGAYIYVFHPELKEYFSRYIQTSY